MVTEVRGSASGSGWLGQPRALPSQGGSYGASPVFRVDSAVWGNRVPSPLREARMERLR